MSEHKCCKMVSDLGGYHFNPCGKPGKVEHEGKWYCGIHNPIRKAAKDAERQAKWDAEWAEKRAAWALQKAALSATAGLSTAYLTALAEAGGVKRVLELLALAAEVQGCTEMTHEDAYHALFKQPTLDNVWLPIRALLEKLGGVE